jgi:hypothetical protein
MCAAPGPQRRHHDAEDRAPTQRPDGQEIVEVILKPGEMSLHDADILHGSSPNQSSEIRLGFVIRFITPEAKAPCGRPPVIMARGIADCHHFEIVDPPGENHPEQALAGMKESAALHLDTVLQTIKRPGR